MDFYTNTLVNAKEVIPQSSSVAANNHNDGSDIDEINLDDMFREQSMLGGMLGKRAVKKKTTTRAVRSAKRSTPNRQTYSKPFKCDNCAESFNVLANLNLHKTVHTDPPFYCIQCHKAFGRCSSFLGHIKTHFRNEHFTCKFCGQTFGYYSVYERHLRTEHQDSHAYDISERKLKIKTSQGEKRLQFRCEQCKKMFGRASSLRRHERLTVKSNMTINWSTFDFF